MNRLITLTEERLNKAKTPKGGYCKTQLQVLGIDWPAKKGWRKDLIGTKVTLRRFIAFVVASKNKLYLEEIEGLLPTLTPPVVDLIQTPLPSLANQQQVAPKKHKLSNKELKRERTAAKRAERNADREQRIRDYGIHNATSLIFDKVGAEGIRHTDKSFIYSLLREDEPFIDSGDVRRLYNTLTRYGIILSYRRGGGVSPSGFTRVTIIRKEQLLYVIRAKGTDTVKIGVSKDPKARRRELQTSNPKQLTISMVFETNKNAVKLENDLHKFFHKQRMQGEWFESVTNEQILNRIDDRAKLVTTY